jgi:hypothetical protein
MTSSHRSGERLDARDVTADDQGMDVIGALVCVHSLEVDHVADDAVFVNDSVS